MCVFHCVQVCACTLVCVHERTVYMYVPYSLGKLWLIQESTTGSQCLYFSIWLSRLPQTLLDYFPVLKLSSGAFFVSSIPKVHNSLSSQPYQKKHQASFRRRSRL